MEILAVSTTNFESKLNLHVWSFKLVLLSTAAKAVAAYGTYNTTGINKAATLHDPYNAMGINQAATLYIQNHN